jgi:nitrite reductase/ring-hydroxylating ferredoxin subunit
VTNPKHLICICDSTQLVDRGRAVRFVVEGQEEAVPAFVVRFGGRVYGYVNRCPHMHTELDWLPGELFDESGVYLVCATHGAIFSPPTGYCCGGPCRGQSLRKVPVLERDGKIYCLV